MDERRMRPRSRMLRGAKLFFGKSSTVDCVVRNLTNVGAGIEIQNTIHLPNELEMTFDAGRSIRPCRIVWRTLTRVGLEFYEVPPLLR